MSNQPTLRPLDFQPVIYEGQRMWLLRDPLQLSEQQLIMPPALAQMLLLVDGTKSPEEIHVAFCTQMGEDVAYEIVAATLEQLDQACLLDNERARAAREEAVQRYRAQPFRPPALADISYPADPQALTNLFREYGREDDLNGWEAWTGRAVVSPHIDYERGGTVYAKVWERARAAVAEADLVLIFGTDHSGGPGSITLTRQPYATPFGVIPTDDELITTLAEAIGPEHAFGLELNHRQEHSVELSAVWLHHLYREIGKGPAPMAPILCGSFQHFLSNGHHPAVDKRLKAFVETLQEATAGRRVLAVASVDLAHVGPAFGDRLPMNEERRERLTEGDRRLIEAINRGDHGRFYDEIAGVNDRNRICGFSSTYLMLRYLENTGPIKGVEVAYDHCPADEQEESFVSICGLLLD